MGKSKDLATGAAYQDQTESDARYVNTAGDTMTGKLALTQANSNTPPFVIEAATEPNDFSVSGYSDANGAYYMLGANVYLNSGGNTATWESSENSAGILLDSRGPNGVEIYTGTGTGSTKLKVDGSGRVTMPSQTSFYAYTSSDYTATGNLTGGGNWATRWDTGNNFSAGTFTAPIGGKYYFEVMWDANSIQSTIDIQVNTTAVIRYEPTGRTDSTWETHHYSAILNLATNDSVRLYGNKHGASSNYPYHMGGSGQWGHFAGFLIG